jgi:hypothetical protein
MNDADYEKWYNHQVYILDKRRDRASSSRPFFYDLNDCEDGDGNVVAFEADVVVGEVIKGKDVVELCDSASSEGTEDEDEIDDSSTSTEESE